MEERWKNYHAYLSGGQMVHLYITNVRYENILQWWRQPSDGTIMKIETGHEVYMYVRAASVIALEDCDC